LTVLIPQRHSQHFQEISIHFNATFILIPIVALFGGISLLKPPQS
jgi:hypothetical protein